MKIENQIETFFSKHFPFNKEGLDELLNSFEDDLLKKGQIILQPDQVEHKLRFITSGYVREYYLTHSKEVNINFYGQQEFSTDIYSFYSSTKTKKWQECISNVKSKTLSKTKFDELLKKYSCGHSIVSKSMEKLIKQKNNIEFNRTTKETKELYRDIVNQKPAWLKHIPQYHIASYLNVTPETLSRIRKRIIDLDQ